MDRFSYNAPDFFDFSKDLDYEDVKMAEKFFEIEHENHSSGLADSPQLIDDSGEQGFDNEFYTPLKKTPVKIRNNTEKQLRQNPKGLRRSLSMGNIASNEEEATSLEINDDINIISNGIDKLRTSKHQKSYQGPKMLNATLSSAHSISKDHIDKLAQPKRKYVSQEDLCLKRYVSMAEAINQFHQKTPKRFHSKANSKESIVFKHSGPLSNTIPQSPTLATKNRARPTHVLSTEEQELKEFEEAKKYQIKAHPVNPRILKGPVQLKPVNVKPLTKPEPFKLTEVLSRKTLVSTTPPPYEFHAKPLPKSILEPPKPVIKSALHTNPVTPNLMKRHRVDHTKYEVAAKGIAKDKPHSFKLEPTKPLPFSFEQRDKEILKKREKLINEVLQEEKKAREFHAQPVPTNIFKSPLSDKILSFKAKRHHSDGSLVGTLDNVVVAGQTFKAKPAKVLQMKPFEPKKGEHVIEFAEFSLSTETRAKERALFEQKKKEKQEELAQILKQKEEEMAIREIEEIKRLRILTEHKAQPIRRYIEVKPQPSKPLTAPVSPKFSCKSKHKESVSVEEKENSASHI